jgi:hypothetical protein
LIAAPAAVWASVHRVVLRDNFPVAVVRCIQRAASLVVVLREVLVPVSDSRGPVLAVLDPALVVHAQEWARLALFRLREKPHADSSALVARRVVDASNTRRPKKAR